MKRQELRDRGQYEIVEAPRADSVALPRELLRMPQHRTAAAPDVPVAAGGLMVAAYAALLAAFPLLIAHDGSSFFAIVIGAFYLAMFFGVPAVFFRIEADSSRRPELSLFLERGMQTATGHISGRGALVQMLVVPVLLAGGVVAIGLFYVLL
jgi:hypothetical protein